MNKKKFVTCTKAIALVCVLSYVPRACEMNRVSNIVDEMPHEMYAQIQEEHQDWNMDQIAYFYAEHKDSLQTEAQDEIEWKTEVAEYRRAHPETQEVCQEEVDGLNTSAMWLSYCEKYGIDAQHPTVEQENEYLDVWCETDEAEELAIEYSRTHNMK